MTALFLSVMYVLLTMLLCLLLYWPRAEFFNTSANTDAFMYRNLFFDDARHIEDGVYTMRVEAGFPIRVLYRQRDYRILHDGYFRLLPTMWEANSRNYREGIWVNIAGRRGIVCAAPITRGFVKVFIVFLALCYTANRLILMAKTQYRKRKSGCVCPGCGYICLGLSQCPECGENIKNRTI
jgi:hypothetical protein